MLVFSLYTCYLHSSVGIVGIFIGIIMRALIFIVLVSLASSVSAVDVFLWNYHKEARVIYFQRFRKFHEPSRGHGLTPVDELFVRNSRSSQIRLKSGEFHKFTWDPGLYSIYWKEERGYNGFSCPETRVNVCSEQVTVIFKEDFNYPEVRYLDVDL